MYPLLKKSLVQRFSTGGDFCTQGTLGNVWRHFCLSQEGPLVKSNGRESQEAKHSTMDRDSPHSRESSRPQMSVVLTLIWG